MIREKEIELFTKIGIDKKTLEILKSQKKIQKKSMMRIVKDLVEEKYL